MINEKAILEQADALLEEYRSGKKQIKRLKSFKPKSIHGKTFSDVVCFGCIVVLINTWEGVDGLQHSNFQVCERKTKKGFCIWNTLPDDIWPVYRVAIAISLLEVDWEAEAEKEFLPEDVQKFIIQQFREINALVSIMQDFLPKITALAEASRALSRSAL